MSEHTPGDISRKAWHYRFIRWFFNTLPLSNFYEPLDICDYRKAFIISALFALPLFVVKTVFFALGLILYIAVVGMLVFFCHKPNVGYIKGFSDLFSPHPTYVDFEPKFIPLSVIALLGYPAYDLLLHGFNWNVLSWYTLTVGFLLCAAVFAIVLVWTVVLVGENWDKVGELLYKMGQNSTVKVFSDMYRSAKDKVCWRINYKDN